ncbi:protein phosphatase 1 regulatory subunit 1B [Trichomycterus rosablanca]|uniref:protein phosphatase 1 regulatory subunit 1B n=1 Tax=Trichomycterus rosablanca TaxID=2290929 RepID=UPI002F3608E5
MEASDVHQEPKEKKKIHFDVPSAAPTQLDPRQVEMIRRRRPTPATLFKVADQPSPEDDYTTNQWVVGENGILRAKRVNPNIYQPPPLKAVQEMAEAYMQRLGVYPHVEEEGEEVVEPQEQEEPELTSSQEEKNTSDESNKPPTGKRTEEEEGKEEEKEEDEDKEEKEEEDEEDKDKEEDEDKEKEEEKDEGKEEDEDKEEKEDEEEEEKAEDADSRNLKGQTDE